VVVDFQLAPLLAALVAEGEIRYERLPAGGLDMFVYGLTHRAFADGARIRFAV